MRSYVIAEQKPGSAAYKLAQMIEEQTGFKIYEIQTRHPRGYNSADMANWGAFSEYWWCLGGDTMRDCVKWGIKKDGDRGNEFVANKPD